MDHSVPSFCYWFDSCAFSAPQSLQSRAFSFFDMKSLIIAEKPSVASEIAKALGGFKKTEQGFFERDDLLVSSAVGHLVTLHVPEAEDAPKGMAGLPILPTKFSTQPVDRAASQLSLLSKLVKRPDVGALVNACDAGREGELIFGLIVEHLKCDLPVTRMWFQTMTAEGMREAFVNARPASERAGLLAAAKCRSESDWLVGINSSRACTALRSKEVGGFEAMNAGRVQTPTLAIVVRRENEIREFTSRDFWEIVGAFDVQAGQYKGKLHNPNAGDDGEAGSKSRFFDKAAAESLLARMQTQPVQSATQTVSENLRQPPNLFDLTTLQREANKRFKFSAKKTLDIAQRLYEKFKMTTYPRTDSSALPEDYVDTCKETMSKLHGSPWDAHARAVSDNDWIKGNNKRIFNNDKITDHFAIIPTGQISGDLEDADRKIYTMIAERFIAAFFPAAQIQNTKRVTVIDGCEFHSAGTVVIDPGWMKVVKELDENGNVKSAGSDLCALSNGETPTVGGLSIAASKTSPPSRFTEASLLAAMETAGKEVEDEELRAAMKERGLGTPATRASIIETLCDTGSPTRPKEPYLIRDKQFLVPTDKGMHLIEFLNSNGAGFLTTPATTGDWEHKLELMSKGLYERPQFMAEIARTTSELIDTLKAQSAKIVTQSTKLDCMCPKCKSASAVSTRNGFSCEAECGFRLFRTIAQRVMSDQEMTEILNGKLVGVLSGFKSKAGKKFDAYVKLGEGKLEFVFPGSEGAPLEKLDCSCPKCDGVLVKKRFEVECKDCQFKAQSGMAGYQFSDKELEVLFTTGKLGLVKGFQKADKTRFDAGVSLSLVDGTLSFDFDTGETLKAPCPCCGGAVKAKPKLMECGGCGLKAWRSMSGRDFKDSELETLLSKGSLKEVSGFKSSKPGGKGFSAGVKSSVVEDDKGKSLKFEFVFSTKKR